MADNPIMMTGVRNFFTENEELLEALSLILSLYKSGKVALEYSTFCGLDYTALYSSRCMATLILTKKTRVMTAYSPC